MQFAGAMCVPDDMAAYLLVSLSLDALVLAAREASWVH